MNTTYEHELEAERLKLREALRFAYQYPQAILRNQGFRDEVATLIGLETDNEVAAGKAGNICEDPGD